MHHPTKRLQDAYFKHEIEHGKWLLREHSPLISGHSTFMSPYAGVMRWQGKGSLCAYLLSSLESFDHTPSPTLPPLCRPLFYYLIQWLASKCLILLSLPTTYRLLSFLVAWGDVLQIWSPLVGHLGSGPQCVSPCTVSYCSNYMNWWYDEECNAHHRQLHHIVFHTPTSFSLLFAIARNACSSHRGDLDCMQPLSIPPKYLVHCGPLPLLSPFRTWPPVHVRPCNFPLWCSRASSSFSHCLPPSTMLLVLLHW